MSMRETFEQLNSRGKIGAITLAAGALAMSAALGLSLVNDMEINGHDVVDVPKNTPIAVAAIGGAASLFGQSILIAGYRREQQGL